MPVRVHVSNFQSIADAEVEIDGFTVVTGTNNTGKTALQRAIRAVFQNTPGTSFIREGETTCQVTVDFGDRKVLWSKGTSVRSRPTYVLDDGEPIYPGQGVPDEVAALGVVPVQAGGQEVWPTIAQQFSGQIFLLDKPGSAMAEAVADVARVGQLNRALSKAESDRRQAAATLKVRVSDLADFEDQAARFEGLDDAVVGVAGLEQTQGAVTRIGRAVQGLVVLRDRLVVARQTVDVLAPVASVVVPDPETVKDLCDELAVLGKIQQRLHKAQQDVRRYEGVSNVMVAVDSGPAKRLLDGLKVLKDFRTRLYAARTRLQDCEMELRNAEKALATSEAETTAALKDLGCCPMCGIEVAP